MLLLTAGIIVTTFLAVLYHRIIYIIFKTLPRDLKAAYRFIGLSITLWLWERQQKTVPKIFHGLVKKHPKKIAFYFEDQALTFEDVDKFSNQVANYFRDQGYQKGDTIALMMESCIEYTCIWLGLAKIGVVTALINSNLVAEPFLHCVTVANSKAIIYGSNLKKVLEDLDTKISAYKLYQFNDKSYTGDLLPKAVNLRSELSSQSERPPLKEVEKQNVKDKLIYIYTSGTTGLPKAAVISHMRFIMMTMGISKMFDIRENDIIYDPLPLYHTSGTIAGVGHCLLRGVTVAIRKKFSASNFWTDCMKYKCTVAQYIGETCRYILAAHSNNDKPIEHCVRMMFGNGLRPQIWEQFRDKFHVQDLCELYGATEGNSNLVNIDNTVGSVGFVPIYAGSLYPVTLIRCNEATGEPIRNKEGFCIKCKAGEPGICIGKVDNKKVVNSFSGYADTKATEKKLIKDVFEKGDLYFNSGDILYHDEFGYYFFKDRTGDTFRWKGENVATSEVEAVISNVVDLKDAVVYGVQIPGTEGRAGMAAIVDTNDTLDVNKLAKGLKGKLPSYAIPIFLRVMKQLPMTGTYKLKKNDLQEEGFNIYKIKDHLYIYDPKEVSYKELTEKIYEDIMSMKMKL